jgi:hypothetical protein
MKKIKNLFLEIAIRIIILNRFSPHMKVSLKIKIRNILIKTHQNKFQNIICLKVDNYKENILDHLKIKLLIDIIRDLFQILDSIKPTK